MTHFLAFPLLSLLASIRTTDASLGLQISQHNSGASRQYGRDGISVAVSALGYSRMLQQPSDDEENEDDDEYERLSPDSNRLVVFDRTFGCKWARGDCKNHQSHHWLLTSDELADCKRIVQVAEMKFVVTLDMWCAKTTLWGRLPSCDKLGPTNAWPMFSNCEHDDMVSSVCEILCDTGAEGERRPMLKCTFQYDHSGALGLRKDHIGMCYILDGECETDFDERHRIMCTGFDADETRLPAGGNATTVDGFAEGAPVPGDDDRVALCQSNGTTEGCQSECLVHYDNVESKIRSGCPNAAWHWGAYGPACYASRSRRSDTSTSTQMPCFVYADRSVSDQFGSVNGTTAMSFHTPHVSCKGEWTQWSVCDDSCKQTRSFTITQPHVGRGSRCKHEEGAQQTRKCACPETATVEAKQEAEKEDQEAGEKSVDCVGVWADWSQCQANCKHIKSFRVTQEKQGDGKECPVADGTQIVRACRDGQCGNMETEAEKNTTASATSNAMACEGRWSQWSACGAECLRMRTFKVTKLQSQGGEPCPAADGQFDVRPCNSDACEPANVKNCYGAFSEWSKCMAQRNRTCARSRVYSVIRPAYGKGTACLHPDQTVELDSDKCEESECELSDLSDKQQLIEEVEGVSVGCEGKWGEWGPCSKQCVKERLYTVTKRPEGEGRACAIDAGYVQRVGCQGDQCPNKSCNGTWSEWSACGSDCMRNRTFIVAQQREGDGNECPHKHMESQQQPCYTDQCSEGLSYAPVGCYEKLEHPSVTVAVPRPIHDPSVMTVDLCFYLCSHVNTPALLQAAYGNNTLPSAAEENDTAIALASARPEAVTFPGYPFFGLSGGNECVCGLMAPQGVPVDAAGGTNTNSSMTLLQKDEGVRSDANKIDHRVRVLGEGDEEPTLVLDGLSAGPTVTRSDNAGGQCSTACEGDREQSCGGPSHVQMYQRNVDCRGTWSMWEPCDETCTKHRTYTITRTPQNDGTPCKRQSGFVQSIACNLHLCTKQQTENQQIVAQKAKDKDKEKANKDNDKEAANSTTAAAGAEAAAGASSSGDPYVCGDPEYGEWSKCSAECERWREKTVRRATKRGGYDCDKGPLDEVTTKVTEKCTGDMCLPTIDCKGVWGAWSVCDDNCLRRRTYQVLTEAQGGGRKCLHDDGETKAEICTEGQDSSCGGAAECEGRWGKWGECDSQCRRTRRFIVEGNCPSEKQTDQMQVSTCPPDMCQSTKPSSGDQFLPKSSQEGSVTVDLTLNVQYGEVADVATVFTDTLSNRLSQLTEVPRERLSVDMATPPLSEDNEKDNVTVEVVIAKGDQPSAADVLARLRERYTERLRMGRFGNDVRIIGLDGKVQAAPAAAAVEEPLGPGDGGDSPVLPIGLPVIFAFIIMVALICGGWCMCRRCKGKARLLQSADDSSSSKASHSSWVQTRSTTGSTSASSRATSRKADMKSSRAPRTGRGFGYDGMKDEAEDMGGDISLGVAPTPTSQTPSSRSVVPDDATPSQLRSPNPTVLGRSA
ncbi:unnamed protein product [Vitrella brassicaformis CCMP3155]|uniref:Spondin-like TSP1 domain-containing protein n=2 Tax=Vitrella brassicaformis TaxID=1169539 RepID=A0A0G4EKJ4_VITBC|nr:unnamed protein product [Vitrella brassicaformis CCMP3155]|eukprot:CEL96943.1 unnamed protein product [Vitrella brassicaformis CCMP3155]